MLLRAKLLVAPLLLLILSEANAQSGDALLQEAHQLYDANEFSKSAIAFDKALRAGKNFTADEYYDAACSHSLAGNLQQALSYLKIAFRLKTASGKMVVTAPHLTTDTDLDNIRYAPEFRSLVTQYYPAGDAMMMFEKEISDEQLWKYVNEKVQDGLSSITIHNKVIYWKKSGNGYITNDRGVFRNSPLNSNSTTSLHFENCTFEYSLIIGRTGRNIELNHLTFDHCKFKQESAFVLLDLKNPFSFKNCEFDGLYFAANIQSPSRDIDYNDAAIVFDSCRFGSMRSAIDIFSDTPINFDFTNNVLEDSAVVVILGNQFGNINFKGVKGPHAFARLEAPAINTLHIDRSEFDTLCITNSQIASRFNFLRSSIHGQFLMMNATFSDNPSNQARWASFSNGKLGLIKDFQLVYRGTGDRDGYRSPKFINGTRADDFKNGDEFASLMGTYSLFLNQYKSNNDLESYNKCFIELKELQSQRLKYLYETHGGFEAYFRWKLAQLLKF
jgi:tetratricopeptide (TPR) repeat protein